MGIQGSPQVKPDRKSPKRSGAIKMSDDEHDIDVTLHGRKLRVSEDAWKSFKFYQQYEDWANETEKTDYTYSRLSKYRNKEIAPGLPNRPNLSRSPIKKFSSQTRHSFTNSNESFSHANESFFRKVENTKIVDDVDSAAETENTWFSAIKRFTLFLLTLFVSSYRSCYSALSKFGSFTTQSVFFSWTSLTDVFSAVWTTPVRLITYIASVSSTIWTKNTSFWKRLVNKLFVASDESYTEDNSSAYSNTWEKSTNIISRSTKLVWSFVTNTVTTVYSRSREVVAERGSRRWLWLLVPILLAAGIWLFFDTPDILKTIPSIPPLVFDFFCFSVPFFLLDTMPHFFYSVLPNAIYSMVPNLQATEYLTSVLDFFPNFLPKINLWEENHNIVDHLFTLPQLIYLYLFHFYSSSAMWMYWAYSSLGENLLHTASFIYIGSIWIFQQILEIFFCVYNSFFIILTPLLDNSTESVSENFQD